MGPRAPEILVVDDHADMARLLADQLLEQGWQARIAHSGPSAIAALDERIPDVVVTDLRLPDIDGFGVLAAARARDPELPVIVMTAFGEIATAVEAMRRGAWHFVAKPVRLAELVAHTRRALARRGARPDSELVGASEPMRELGARIARAARSEATVLIRGETGTGKELVARAIHRASDRSARPFVAVNCTALPEGLAESELFGHVRGAFTGAASARTGLFVQADRGTLFLDEMGDLPLALQAKLLRVLQDRVVRPVGDDSTRTVDVRVIAATHQDLEARVASGAFREDLFYRLDVLQIAVPPLRARPGDIAELVAHFLAAVRRRDPRLLVDAFAPDVLDALARYAWPGNVRELANVVERLAVGGEEPELRLEHLRALAPHLFAAPARTTTPRLATLREVEDGHIGQVLAACNGDKPRAAAILGIDISTLYRRLKAST